MIGKLLAVAAVGLLSANAEGTVRVEKTEYEGWPNCYRVSNGEVELIVTGDVGPRVIWKVTRKYLTLRQDPNNHDAQKLGLFNKETWAAYFLDGEAFLKRTKADPTKTYPDFGASFETFTNSEFLEVETLGPLTKLQPAQTVELTETWSLFRNVKLLAISDDELDRVVLPMLKSADESK